MSGIYRHGYKPRYDNYITVLRKTNENGLIHVCKNSLFVLYSNIFKLVVVVTALRQESRVQSLSVVVLVERYMVANGRRKEVVVPNR